MTQISIPPLSQLRTRTSAKWRTFADDVLPLPVAEMDFDLAHPIRDKLIALINNSDTGYGGIIPELGQSFARYSAQHWGWNVDPEQFRLANDVGVAGIEVLRVVTAPGDAIVVNTPVYLNFQTWIAEADRTLLDVPLIDRGNGVWDLDFDGLEKAFASGATAYLLCNPHNPVGTVFCQEHLEIVAALAKKYNVVVISDEIHAPLNYTNTPFMPYLNVNDDARETGVCITSASKSWNLAGLKCAQIITDNSAMNLRLDALPKSVPWRASILGAWASVAAYDDGQPWLDAVMQQLRSNRDYLAEELPKFLPKAVYFKPESTYLAWIDLAAYNQEDPAEFLLEKARVALSPGKEFGPNANTYIRLNFATSQDNLAQALKQMADVLE